MHIGYRYGTYIKSVQREIHTLVSHVEDLGFLGSNIVKAEAGKMHVIMSWWTACFNICWHNFLWLRFNTPSEEEHYFCQRSYRSFYLGENSNSQLFYFWGLATRSKDAGYSLQDCNTTHNILINTCFEISLLPSSTNNTHCRWGEEVKLTSFSDEKALFISSCFPVSWDPSLPLWSDSLQISYIQKYTKNMQPEHLKDMHQQQNGWLTDRLHVVVKELVEASGAVRAHEVHEVSSASRTHRRLCRAFHHGLLEGGLTWHSLLGLELRLLALHHLLLMVELLLWWRR